MGRRCKTLTVHRPQHLPAKVDLILAKCRGRRQSEARLGPLVDLSVLLGHLPEHGIQSFASSVAAVPLARGSPQ